MINEEYIKSVAADAFGCSVDNIRIRPKFWSIAKFIDGNDNTTEIALSKETNQDVLYYIVSLDLHFVQSRLNIVDVEGNILSSITDLNGLRHMENALLKNLYFTRAGSTFHVYAQAMYYEVTRF